MFSEFMFIGFLRQQLEQWDGLGSADTKIASNSDVRSTTITLPRWSLSRICEIVPNTPLEPQLARPTFYDEMRSDEMMTTTTTMMIGYCLAWWPLQIAAIDDSRGKF
jgi:hypothetical protein